MKRPSESSLIEEALNLGPKSSAWLREVGIFTVADLRRIGAVAAYQLVQRNQSRVSLNLLWALAGAEQNRHWTDLTPAEKEALKAALEE